jgi:pimeloyl-ACP methyl ester carboxylesterase
MPRRLLCTLCFCVLVLLAPQMLGVASPAYTPHFESTTCTLNYPSGYTVDCGFLVVPENRTLPQGKTIRVAVARIHARNTNPQPDPVIFVAGGPGNTLLEEVVRNGMSPMLNNWLTARDVILLDQRGVGSSRPALACPAFDYLNTWGLTQAQAEAKSLNSFRDCGNWLTSQGIDLPAYNTRENVADLADLPVALGYEQVNFYGFSYGSFVVLNIMRLHPEHIRSAILEGISPPDRNPFTDYSTNFEYALRQMIAECSANSACAMAYPDLEQATFKLIAQLNQQPVSVTIANSTTGTLTQGMITGDQIITIFRQRFRYPINVKLMPEEIYAIGAQQFEMIDPFLQNLTSRSRKSTDPNDETYYTYRCSDNVLGQPASAVDQALANTHVSLQPYFRENARVGQAYCAAWPVSPVDQQLLQPVVSSIPTLMFSGMFDPMTPPFYAKHVQETLAQSHLFEFPTMGHGVAVSDDMCAVNMMGQFLDTPLSAPDASCIAHEPTIQFSLPNQ